MPESRKKALVKRGQPLPPTEVSKIRDMELEGYGPKQIRDATGYSWDVIQKYRVETKIKRKRVHKWILSGAEVLEDCGYIAGECIPVIPFCTMRANSRPLAPNGQTPMSVPKAIFTPAATALRKLRKCAACSCSLFATNSCV